MSTLTIKFQPTDRDATTDQWQTSNGTTLTQSILSKDRYIIDGMKFRATLTKNNGYYVYISKCKESTTTWHVLLETQGSHSAGTLELSLPESSWSEWAEGSNLKYLVRVKRRGSLSQQYVNMELEVTYHPVMSPSTGTQTNAYIGDPQVVTVSNSDHSAQHKITWTYGSVTSGPLPSSGYYEFVNDQCVQSWAITNSSDITSLLNATPNSDTINGIVTIDTYSSSEDFVGSYQLPVVLKIPDSYKPVVSMTTSITRDQYPQYNDTNFQNHTVVSITPSISTQYGASVVSKVVKVNDTQYQVGDSQINVRLTNTQNLIEFTVKDSRGFENSTSTSVSTTSYTDPQILTASVSRYNKTTGTVDDEGTSFIVTVTDKLDTSAGPRTTTVDDSYNVIISGITIQNKEISRTGNKATIIFDGSPAFSPDSSYNILLTLYDGYGTSTSLQTQIGTAIYTIYRLIGGKGVAFGTTATKYGVEVAQSWPMYVHGKEIQHLILDIAHPVSSVMLSVDVNFDPNIEWPWTHWANQNILNISPNVTINTWIRTL